MTAPYNPDQQAYPPQPYHQFPEGGYQPAPAQFPAHDQPPGYDYGGHGYQSIPAPAPIIGTSTTIVMTAQPTPVTTTHQAPPEADYSGMATCALVFAIITLLCCWCTLVGIPFSIGALLLANKALGTTGSSQKSNAGVSIAINVTVVICTVLLLVVLAFIFL